MSSLQAGVIGTTSSSGSIIVAIGGNGTLGSGSQTVATAGTRVQLSGASIPSKKLTIQGLKTNTGAIYIGDSTVFSGNGIFVFATQIYEFTPSNLNLVWIDADNSGEGVHYLYEN